MPSKPTTIDEYLAELPKDRRAILEDLRATIKSAAPNAAEVISYGIPAFRVEGEVVGGFAAFRNHYSYFPFSGAVVDQFADDLTDYDTAKGTIHFTAQHPLPADLVRRMVEAHIAAHRSG